MIDSSSGHTLNADTGLRSWRKLAYLAVNAVNDIRPGYVDARLKTKPFRPDATREEWFAIDAEASMARKWSNLFWQHLPWERLAREAGPLRILDMGCGPGGYGPRILGWAGNAVESYLGVEPSSKYAERWQRHTEGDRRLAYARGSSDDIERFLEGPVNMLISQSSLEHIDRDVLLFRRVARSLELHPRPFVQVHLVPAGATLPLYLFHGIRQYTPRTLSKITELFPDASVALYGLGGRSSWRLHWRSVTWPHYLPRLMHMGAGRDLRTLPGYSEQTWQAYADDIRHQAGPALFYALILCSGGVSATLPDHTGLSRIP